MRMVDISKLNREQLEDELRTAQDQMNSTACHMLVKRISEIDAVPSGFGFSIPNGATIIGADVTFMGKPFSWEFKWRISDQLAKGQAILAREVGTEFLLADSVETVESIVRVMNEKLSGKLHERLNARLDAISKCMDALAAIREKYAKGEWTSALNNTVGQIDQLDELGRLLYGSNEFCEMCHHRKFNGKCPNRCD